ncbi:helix-turn-helix domain-containing protein [Fibrella arboris]|uniref:helix-turn-helix domain-containing protein n=1 Tax=Fibrella arboris TaxID=3242486 RepID=UPI003522283B
MKPTHNQAITSTTEDTDRARAYRYYLHGLTCKEIGKLLDLSPRTIERYSQLDRWREKANPQPLADRARILHQQGVSYAGIAKALQISKATVYNYLHAKLELSPPPSGLPHTNN